MLTDQQVLENKKKFIEILAKLNIDLTSFIKYLESDRVDYFNKPYNAYADCAYRGSLCEMALKRYAKLVTFVNMFYPNKYSEADIIIVSLLRDIYRAEMYEAYTKNVKNEVTGQWENQIAYRVKEIRPIFGDIYFSSYMIIKKFIRLDSDEVVEAICYSGNSQNIELHNIRKDYKLVTLETMAELAAAYLED